MNTRKLHFVLSLALVLATLAGTVTPATVGGQTPPVSATPTPSRGEIHVVHVRPLAPNDAGSAGRSPRDYVGFFPGARLAFGIDAPPTYPPEDQPLPFYIDVLYPYPYTTLYKILGAADGYPLGQLIDSCVHQAAQHKIHCVGEIPPGDQPIDPSYFDFFFVLEGTCSLYTDPQDTVPIKPSSDLWFGQTYDKAVEPILDLTALADSPTDGAKDVFIESSHQGPLLEWHDQTAGYVCGDGSDPYTQDIAYAVDIQRQGQPARRVGDQQGNCTRQVQLSETDLSCLDNGDPAPWTWIVSAVDIKYSPCVDPLLKKDNNFQFTTASCRPEIGKVEPRYGEQFFLHNIRVDNTYRVEVDWNGEAYQTPVETPPYGQVHFEINGAEKPANGVDGQEWGAEYDLDMGGDFQADWSGGNNSLNIWAAYRPSWAAQDIESEYQTSQPVVYPFPEWATVLPVGPFTVNAQEGAVEYENTVAYPEDPFNANVTVPGWVPYLGGKKLGILDTQAEGGIEASSAGEGKLSLEGGTGLGMGGFDILGQVGGEGSFKFLSGDGLKMERSTFSLAVSTPFEKEMTLADLIPGIRAAEDWWLVGDLIKKVTRAVKIAGELIPRVSIGADFKQQGHDQWVFEGSVGRGEMAVTVRAEIKPYDKLWVAVYGGGTPFVEINFPASPDYLKRVGIDLVFGAALHAWRWEAKYERAITCSLPQGSCSGSDGEAALMALATGAADDWTLMGRDYVTGDYATFVGGEPAPGAQGVTAASATVETPLVTNVYPLTEPSLAVRADGHRTILYIHDDPAKPAGQGEEILATQWNGVTWTTPITLTDDRRLDFSPQVVYDGAGNAVAVWERSYTDVVTSGLNITFAQQIDVGAMTWHSATGTWDAGPAMLTNDDGLLDHSPRLRAGYDGSVLALWQTSDGVDIVGTADHPVTYTYATWNGTAWGAVTPAIGGLTHTLGMDVAVYSATQAALVYAVDTDGVLTTTSDTELFYSLYDGTAWSGPTRLTTDAITDTTPALVYDADGTLELLWLRGDGVVMLDGSLDVANVRPVRPDSTAAGFLDFTLARSPQGHLALIWQAAHGDLVDLGYAVYDASANGWGADQYLMSDDAVEAALSPAFADDGTLHLAYRKSQTEYVTRTFQISPTLTITVTDLPSRGRSDLYVLSHTVGRDLTVSNLTITPTNPTAGAPVTLTAQVQNVGDLEAGPVEVRFSDGATAIVTVTVAPTMTAGTTLTATAAWTAPATITGPHTLRATVDPAGLVAETFEDDNTAELTVFGPHLVAEWAVRSHDTTAITYTLYITNAGRSPAQAPIPVTLRADDPVSGTLVATGAIPSDVAAGVRVSATVAVTDLASLASLGGDGWLVAGDPAADRANAWPIALGLWPDLTLTAADIQLGSTVTVTVRNAGVMTATGVVLAVWQDTLSGTLVYSGTLGDVGPGASGAVTFTLTTDQVELWAKADPDDRIAESSESNNLAVRGLTVWHRVYLPAVLENYGP